MKNIKHFIDVGGPRSKKSRKHLQRHSHVSKADSFNESLYILVFFEDAVFYYSQKFGYRFAIKVWTAREAYFVSEAWLLKHSECKTYPAPNQPTKPWTSNMKFAIGVCGERFLNTCSVV